MYMKVLYILFIMEIAMKKFKVINPIAKSLRGFRKQIVQAKKGKGSYNRKKEKHNAKD